MDRYETFYKDDWLDTYGFWHRVIDRGEKQIRIIKDCLNNMGKDNIKILDLGCGEGDEIKQVLSSIENKDFEITASDTSKEALDRYQNNNPKHVKKTYECRLEILPKKLSGKFDLILFSHCLYNVDLKNLFSNYMKLLNKNGTMLIFLDSDRGITSNVKKKFWITIHGSQFDENLAEDLISELSRNKIPHDFTEMNYTIDLNKLEKIHRGGLEMLFIPFILRKKNIEPRTLKDIVGYISDLTKNSKIQNNVMVILIRK